VAACLFSSRAVRFPVDVGLDDDGEPRDVFAHRSGDSAGNSSAYAWLPDAMGMGQKRNAVISRCRRSFLLVHLGVGLAVAGVGGSACPLPSGWAPPQSPPSPRDRNICRFAQGLIETINDLTNTLRRTV